MSSQERWDVVLRVLSGPLELEGDIVCRGPVVRMGARPGPGGLNLKDYRGLDDRQAVISAYDGATVSLAPVGTNQVRMAPHPNVDWNELQPLRNPAYLTDGCAFHLGPPGRGVTIQFIEARRLGVWEQNRILSDAAAGSPEVQPSDVKELRTNKGIPAWFLGGLMFIAMGIAVAVVIPLVREYQKGITKLGATDDGEEYYEVVTDEIVTDANLLEGFDQAWFDFVQKPNAELARRKDLKDKENWDTLLLDYVTRSAQQHIKARVFWARLEAVKDDYAYVVSELRGEKLPEVFAAIPYQESRYRSAVASPVCALGYWQFMPEVGRRAGMQVANCKIKGLTDPWTPDRVTPPPNVLKNAPYVKDNKCIITQCTPDERTNLQASTRGAMQLLREPLEDPLIADSGAAVQIAIASHNAGYDDTRYDGNKGRPRNLKHAYASWLKSQKLEFDPGYLGKQVKCKDASFLEQDGCGSTLHRETQHYAYAIIAQHLLAVCYYGQNYADMPEFRVWKDYARGDGYCTRIQIPTSEEAKKWM